MRLINILGATGSIGAQALKVAALHPERFKVNALTAHRSADALFALVRAYRPVMAGLSGLNAEDVDIPADLRYCDWRFGPDALLAAAGEAPCDDVLVAVVGMTGLPAVLAARKAGRRVLLANKEALVAGGKLVMAACPEENGQPTLLPVDSEHSAIFQCLRAAEGNAYARILLTASGGPFRTYTKAQLESATLAQALKHPNWSMGDKVTVDSASLFNKALEMVEARWLFGARPEQIKVLVHPQSIVHSMVEFQDGAVIAQLGMPDMRVPIAYAMAYPERIEAGAPRADFAAIGSCTFEDADETRFPAIRMAYDALGAGGAAACVLNAANEEANARFRRGGMRFTDIARVVARALDGAGDMPADTLPQVYAADAAARSLALDEIKRLGL